MTIRYLLLLFVAAATVQPAQEKLRALSRRVERSHDQMLHCREGDVLLMGLTFPKSNKELLYQLTHGNLSGHMDPAAALQPFGVDAAAGGLRKAAGNDPFWAARRDVLPATDVAFLRERALEVRSSGKRVAALAALERSGAPPALLRESVALKPPNDVSAKATREA